MVTALPLKPDSLTFDSLPWCAPVRGTDVREPLAAARMVSASEADERLARQVARAAATFEHGLLGRAPMSVVVVRSGPWMVVHVHESFSEVERRLADDPASARRVAEVHRRIFDHSAADLLEHVRGRTGVVLHGALAHVDPVTRSVCKTLATSPEIDLFLLGPGLPALGVPVNAHLQANGIAGPGGPTGGRPRSGMPEMEAAGNGADRR